MTTSTPAPDFNSGRLPQPGGAALIATPQGVCDVAVAVEDLIEVQQTATEEAAAAAAAVEQAEKTKRKPRRKPAAVAEGAPGE